MMREPTITVPSSYFVKKSDWALKATGKTVNDSNGKPRFVPNEPAAELISVFLFHYDNRTANRVLVEIIERAIKKHGKYLRDLGDWLPYSNAYMRECLLGTHGQNQIVEGIKVLTDIGFISTEVPAEISEFYSKSHSWYRIEIGNIRHWIRTVWFPSLKTSVYAPQDIEVKEAIQKVTAQVNGKTEKQPDGSEDENGLDTLTKAVNALGAFYKHIHAKNSSYVFDAERKKAVRQQLEQRKKNVEMKRALSICAQAIIGNTFSEFHQAKHPENMLGQINSKGVKGKIFDDIGEHIFKTSKKVESMVDHAEDNDISEHTALNALEGFIRGEPSKYAKGQEKLAIEAATLKSTSHLMDKSEVVKYKSFSFSIAGFFKAGDVPNKDILEMCDSMENLKKQGSGLTNVELLSECLIENGKIKFGSVSESQEKQMKSFAKEFCEIAELNKE